MNALDSLLNPKRVMCQVEAASRKRIFELVAQQVAEDADLTEDLIYAQLFAREKLGSTALGAGVAVPHCRVAGCEQPLGCLVTLAHGVDFDAPDGRELIYFSYSWYPRRRPKPIWICWQRLLAASPMISTARNYVEPSQRANY